MSQSRHEPFVTLSASDRSSHRKLLSAPFVSVLNNPQIQTFRLDYRLYRAGFTRGARGDPIITNDTQQQQLPPSQSLKNQIILKVRNDAPQSTETISSAAVTGGGDGDSTLNETPLSSPGVLLAPPPPPSSKNTSRHDEVVTGYWVDEEDNAEIFDNTIFNAAPARVGDGSELEDASEHNREFLNTITQWRLAYRRFRSGYSHGAEGELEVLSKQFTNAHIRLLPVAQLQQVKVYHTKKSTTRHRDVDVLCASSSVAHTVAHRVLLDRFSGVETVGSTGDVSSRRQSSLHVHFGAGKLGLGLVVVALASGPNPPPFVIWQRESPGWETLLVNVSINTTKLIVNNREICQLFVHRPTDPFETLEAFLIERQQQGLKSNISGAIVFVNSNNEHILQTNLLPKAETFSCALGSNVDKALFPILSSLPDVPPHQIRPRFYTCENDHSAAQRLGSLLDSKVELMLCMVDRICAARTLSEMPPSINVQTEIFEGEIVIKPKEEFHPISCPLNGSNVFEPKFQAIADYLTQRKFLLVNGTHTTLAFITLVKQLANGSQFEPPGDYPLISYESSSEATRRLIRGWSVARCLLLLYEHDLEVIRSAHKAEDDLALIKSLLDYADSALRRFDTVRDSTKRILGGGVENRYMTRLQNVEQFLEANSVSAIPLGRTMLKQASFGVCELGGLIHQLVSEAFKLTPAGAAAAALQDNKIRRLESSSSPFTPPRRLLTPPPDDTVKSTATNTEELTQTFNGETLKEQSAAVTVTDFLQVESYLPARSGKFFFVSNILRGLWALSGQN